METSKIKIIILVLIALLAVGAAGYFWYQLQEQKAKNQIVETKQFVSATPVYVTLKPVTVSMPGVRNGYEVNKTLFVGLALRVPNPKDESIINQYLPEVRNSVLMLLSSQSIDDLEEDAGRLEFKELVKQNLSRFYSEKAKVEIDDVLYTDFIIR